MFEQGTSSERSESRNKRAANNVCMHNYHCTWASQCIVCLILSNAVSRSEPYIMYMCIIHVDELVCIIHKVHILSCLMWIDLLKDFIFLTRWEGTVNQEEGLRRALLQTP